MSEDEIEKLLKERDLFLHELLASRKSLDELTVLVAKQNDRLDEVITMLRRRETELKRAERENRKLRKKLGLDPDPDPEPDEAPPPEADVSDEGPASSEASEPSSSGGAPSNEARQDRNGTTPRPRSKGGRTLLPGHLDTTSETHTACACAHCGSANLEKKDLRSSSKLDVQPFFVNIRTIERARYRCGDCGKPTTAEMPPMPCESAKYTCRFLAWLVVMKFALLVPLDRIHAILETQGVHIAKGTLVHLITRAADLADAVDGEHWKQLKAGSYICFDGTGLKTLIAGQSKAWNGYLEVFTRDELTVFQFDLTKHADRLRERLGEYAGILVCDAESRNGAGARNATFANCNAHPLRAFREAEKSHPHRAAQGRRFIETLYELEDTATDRGLAGRALVEFRRHWTRRVLRRFKVWLTGVVKRNPLKTDPLRQAAQFYLNHFDDLTRFVDHAEIPLDNNTSERNFQRHAKLRYASLFAGSTEGGHRWATLFGVVRTAQLCGVDVMAYLTWMFERRGTYRARFAMSASELTPMAYRDCEQELPLAA
ncbi:MAG: IS66 family transposase [Myxococcota bacterium]